MHKRPETPTETLTLARVPTPVGEVLVALDAEGSVRALDFHDYEPRLRTLLARRWGAVELVDGPAPIAVRRALDAYFDGDVRAFDRLRLKTGGTAFQRAVWAALSTIPAGTTETYAGLARRIGSPKAVRAVGLANGANPIAIALPCHRVIGSEGRLTGYAGGLERKRALLAHEAEMAQRQAVA